MFTGALGVPPGGWPKKLQSIILRGAKPQNGPSGRQLQAVDFASDAAGAGEESRRTRSRATNLLSYLLYPEVFLKYDEFRKTYADVSVLPTPAFFYGLRPGRRNHRRDRSPAKR